VFLQYGMSGEEQILVLHG